MSKSGREVTFSRGETVRPFKDLLAWRAAHALTLEVYRVTGRYPRAELFGLTSQTRRSAASVPGNLAEGCGKRSKAQLRHSVDIAAGSLSELEYWLMLARDLGYLPPEGFKSLGEQLNDTRRLLLGFSAWSAR